MRHILRTLVRQAALLAVVLSTVGAAHAAATVTVNSSSWSPDPAFVQQTITSPISSTDSAAPTPQNEDKMTQVWSYTTGTVYVSSTGNAGTFSASSGNYSIGWGPNGGDDTQSGFTFNGVFFSPGYYLIQVNVSVTYTDTTTNTVLATDTGTGYVGGSASLLSGGGGGNAANAMAAGAQPNAAGGGNGGVPVRVNGKLVITLAKTTTALTKTITGLAEAVDQNGNILSDVAIDVTNSQDSYYDQPGSNGQVDISYDSTAPGSIKFTATTSDLPSGSNTASASVTVVPPTSEITSWIGWSDGEGASSGSVGTWGATLQSTSYDFSSLTLEESSGGVGSDTCYFPQSTIRELNQITYGQFFTGTTNYWPAPGTSADNVGWSSTAVTYYRGKSRVPCGFTFQQIMSVISNGIKYSYQTNTLAATIGTTTVSSTRGGQTKTENF